MLSFPRIVSEYRDNGWTPFPLPRRQKYPPPGGITGASARPITDRDYTAWVDAWANIGLVLPDGVIGIDVDAYKGGELPPGLPDKMVLSTSRNDHESGIHLYRVPKGSHFAGGYGPGVDIIQHTHRYAVVWPSVHPEGRVYEWRDEYDKPIGIPAVRELPWLPDKHLAALQERLARTPASGDGYDGAWLEWCEHLPGGRMSLRVREVIRAFDSEIISGSSRYDAMMRATSRLVAYGRRDRTHRPERGVGEAMDRVIDTYMAAVDGEPDRDPQAELGRAIQGAVEKFGGRPRRRPARLST